jgi:hypothetical protein
VLGTPMTVCFVVLGKYVPGLAPVAMLLSDGAALPEPLVFYQRLIARDRDEATRLAVDYAACQSPEQAFEDLLLPAIARMQRDHAAAVLEQEDRAFVLEATEAIGRAVTGATVQSPQSESPRAAAASDPGASRETARDSAGSGVVLACPVNDDADEVALRLLAMLLDPAQHRVLAMPSGLLASEVVMAVQREHPAAVCFGTLSGGLAQSRYLVKRLRARVPDVPVVVGHWGADANLQVWRDRLTALGASHVGNSLADVRAHLVSLVHQRASPGAASQHADGREVRPSAVTPR